MEVKSYCYYHFLLFVFAVVDFSKQGYGFVNAMDTSFIFSMMQCLLQCICTYLLLKVYYLHPLVMRLKSLSAPFDVTN